MRYSRRRARSHRVRRSVGLAGAVVRGLVFLALVGICVAGIRWIAEGSHGYTDQRSQPLPATSQSLSALAGPHPGEIRARNRRLVFPYSVIPGGVTSADELRETSAHDQTVATHYAGFNYSTQGREVAHRRPDYGAYALRQSGIGFAPGEHFAGGTAVG